MNTSDGPKGWGTRVKNSCLDDVAADRAKWADEPQPMSDFQLLAWLIFAGWALPTIGLAVWACYEPAMWLPFYVFAAFQVWFGFQAVIGE